MSEKIGNSKAIGSFEKETGETFSGKKDLTPSENAVVANAATEEREKRNLETRRSLQNLYDEPKDKVVDGAITKIVKDAKKHTEARKKRRIVYRIGFVVLLVFIAISSTYNILMDRRTKDGVRKPIQKSIEQAIADGDTTQTSHSIEIPEGRVDMKFLATYDMVGLVTYADNYDTFWRNMVRRKDEGNTASEKLMPMDLLIAWEWAAANANEYNWDHAYRGGRIQAKSFDVPMRDSEGDFLHSNNHIIVEPNSDLRKKLLSIRKRDYIHLKGYLVEATFYDYATNTHYTTTSSLSRSDDSGQPLARKTNCEIIYLTDLEIE